MPKVIQGDLDAKGLKFGVVLSRFNEIVSEKLLEGALDCLLRHGASENSISIYKVPGSFELPLFAKKLIQEKKFHAVICLSTLIRGETPHFDFISAQVTKGIAAVGMESGIPVTFGVLTADSLEQALSRAGGKSGNKGWYAALSAIEMSNLYRGLKKG